MGLAQVGGTSFFSAAQDETATTVVTGAVLLFNILGFNSGGSASYIQFFDALEADVVVGTTTPKFVIPLPTGGGLSDAYVLPERFRTGIVIACTGGALTNAAPAADALVKLTYVSG